MNARDNNLQLSPQEMADSCLDALQPWILELYAAAREIPVAAFPEWAAVMMQSAPTPAVPGEKSLLMAHVREAIRINARIRPGWGHDSAVPVGRALVGMRRQLLYSTENLFALIPGSSRGLRDGVVPRAWLRNRTRRGIVAGVALCAIRVGTLWSLRAAPLSGCERLTVRERAIAYAFADGKSYREVARNTGLTPAGVRNGLRRIYTKLGIHNKAQLAAMGAFTDV